MGARRPDGFHEVRTILQTIDWADEIEVERAPAFQFECNLPPVDDTNLVVRAVRRFEARTGIAVAARIRLTKNVPSGAGLGGGSADAAVTWLGLQRMYAAEVSAADLMTDLAALGSDVPYFALGGRAIAVGRGEEVYPLPDEPDSHVLLVVPGIAINTAAAYSWLTRTDRVLTIGGFCGQFLTNGGAQLLVNDLETPVFERVPELEEIKQDLIRSGAEAASLTGSGSVVFGKYRSEAEAVQAGRRFESRYGIRVARTIGRREYQSRMVRS